MDAASGYPFPMTAISDASVWTIPLHLGLLVLCLLPFVFLWRQSRREANRWDLVTLVMVGLIAIPSLLSLRSVLPASSHPFVIGYLLFFEFGCIAAAITTAIRMVRLKKSAQIARFLIGMVVAMFAIGLCLPAVPSAREAARRMQCSNNLKQLGLAMLNYESDYNVFPATSAAGPGGHPMSWRVRMLPFMEGKTLYDQYDAQLPWNADENVPVSQTKRSGMVCLSNPYPKNGADQYYTSYLLVQGPNAYYQKDRGVSVSEAKAGTSNTLGVVEACGTEVVWTEPRDLNLDEYSADVNSPGTRRHTSQSVLSSYHTGGANASFADGSVVFFSKDIDPAVLRALISPTQAPATDAF